MASEIRMLCGAANLERRVVFELECFQASLVIVMIFRGPSCGKRRRRLPLHS